MAATEIIPAGGSTSVSADLVVTDRIGFGLKGNLVNAVFSVDVKDDQGNWAWTGIQLDVFHPDCVINYPGTYRLRRTSGTAGAYTS